MTPRIVRYRHPGCLFAVCGHRCSCCSRRSRRSGPRRSRTPRSARASAGRPGPCAAGPWTCRSTARARSPAASAWPTRASPRRDRDRRGGHPARRRPGAGGAAVHHGFRDVAEAVARRPRPGRVRPARHGVLGSPGLLRRGGAQLRRPGPLVRVDAGRARFYRSVDSAADIEALRVAGGYRKVMLYGVSYGTRVALTYAARHPDRVAALVLDSVVPLDGPDVWSRPSFAAVPRVLRELCAERRLPAGDDESQRRPARARAAAAAHRAARLGHRTRRLARGGAPDRRRPVADAARRRPQPDAPRRAARRGARGAARRPHTDPAPARPRRGPQRLGPREPPGEPAVRRRAEHDAVHGDPLQRDGHSVESRELVERARRAGRERAGRRAGVGVRAVQPLSPAEPEHHRPVRRVARRATARGGARRGPRRPDARARRRRRPAHAGRRGGARRRVDPGRARRHRAEHRPLRHRQRPERLRRRRDRRLRRRHHRHLQPRTRPRSHRPRARRCASACSRAGRARCARCRRSARRSTTCGGS